VCFKVWIVHELYCITSTLHIFAPLSYLYLWLWEIKISWLIGMVAFNITIHTKFLKNLFRSAELELEWNTHKYTARECWTPAHTFSFLERKAKLTKISTPHISHFQLPTKTIRGEVNPSPNLTLLLSQFYFNCVLPSYSRSWL